MLGKLIKHELYSTAQTFGFLYLIVLVVTVINKIFWLIDTDSEVINVLRAVFTVMVIIAFFAAGIITFVYIIYRFFKTMISDEAYLSFTLPVSSAQLIISKTIVAFIWILLTNIVVLLMILLMCCCINLDTETTMYLNMIKMVIKNIDGLYLMIAVCIIMGLISSISGILVIYTSMGIGQLFKKHKVWGSILGFIIIYIITYIISLITSFIMMASQSSTEYFESIAETEIIDTNSIISFIESYIAMMQPFFIASTILNIVYIIILFVISRYLFSRKLNLQ